MLRDSRAYLLDVRDAAGAIQEFVAGMNSADYASSGKVQSAVERKFEIIGEALARPAKLDAVLAAGVPHFKSETLGHAFVKSSVRSDGDLLASAACPPGQVIKVEPGR